MARTTPAGRDQRVDFFRGLALMVIFVDHIPNNVVSFITLRSYAFCDAAELFVFICGYSAAIVFCHRQQQRGTLVAVLESYRRVWILYVVHLFFFVVLAAQVLLAAKRFENAAYLSDMSLDDLLTDPGETLLHALTLQYQPRFLDILPLYIALLVVLPPCLLLPWRYAFNMGLLSLALYLIVQSTGMPMPAWPPGKTWYFNPFAWQMLFCIGALAGRATALGRTFVPYWRPLFWLAAAFAGGAALLSLAWTLADLAPGLPRPLPGLQAMSKTDLSPWRLLNFLSLAYLAVRLVPRDLPFLASPAGRLMVQCGRHSLDLFCLGILLSFLAFIEIDRHGQAAWLQVAASGGGVLVLIGFAALLDVYARAVRGDAARPAPIAIGGHP